MNPNLYIAPAAEVSAEDSAYVQPAGPRQAQERRAEGGRQAGRQEGLLPRGSRQVRKRGRPRPPFVCDRTCARRSMLSKCAVLTVAALHALRQPECSFALRRQDCGRQARAHGGVSASAAPLVVHPPPRPARARNLPRAGRRTSVPTVAPVVLSRTHIMSYILTRARPARTPAGLPSHSGGWSR